MHDDGHNHDPIDRGGHSRDGSHAAPDRRSAHPDHGHPHDAPTNRDEHEHPHDHGRAHAHTREGNGRDGYDSHQDHHHHHDHEHEHTHFGFVRDVLRQWPYLAALALLAYAGSGIRFIGPAERGIVRRFGGVLPTQAEPGVHLGLPLGVERLTRIEIGKTRRVSIGTDLTQRLLGRLPDPQRSQFFTGDRNIVDLQMSAQYAVSDPTAFLFRTADPAEEVRLACESALCAEVQRMPVDDVLTLRKAEIQLRVRERAGRTLANHGVGVRVLSVALERAAPPEAVADAFRHVTSARADRGRKIAEAEGYRDDLQPKARAEAYRIREQAGAEAYATVERARARAARFEKILSEASTSPELTRRRLHAEAAETVLARVRKVIVSRDGATDLRLVEEGP